MKRIKKMALGVFVAGVLGSTAALAAPPSAACRVRGQAALDALTSARYAAVGRHFAPSIAGIVTPEKLQQVWAGIQAKVGQYEKHGALKVRRLRSQEVLASPLTFARARLAFVTACDADNRLSTFRLLDPDLLDAPTIAARTLADGVRVVPLSVPSRFGPLRGALTLPAGKGPFPAVVLVAGSGPSDMDETVGGAKPFRDIANGLAKAGVASLRYDKRQVDYPRKVAANAALTMDEEVTDDAVAAARLLAKQARIDPRRVFVAGHSEGGMLAPRIARRDGHLAGLILLAAPARPLLTVMAEQAREQGERHQAPASALAAMQKKLADEAALLTAVKPGQTPQGQFMGVPQTWWLGMQRYHQMAVAQTLALPMLVLQGGSDFQVSPSKDFAVWKKALGNRHDVTFHLFPGLSHLFTPAGKTGTPADYAAPAHVAPAVVAAMAKWIKAQPAR